MSYNFYTGRSLSIFFSEMKRTYLFLSLFAVIIFLNFCGPAFRLFPDGKGNGLCLADDESDSAAEQKDSEMTAGKETAQDEDKQMDAGMSPPTEDREAGQMSREQKDEEAAAKKETAADEDVEADKGDQQF